MIDSHDGKLDVRGTAKRLRRENGTKRRNSEAHWKKAIDRHFGRLTDQRSRLHQYLISILCGNSTCLP
jgi:hypothetical protein